MRKIVPVLGIIVALLIAGCASDNGIDEGGYSKKPLYNRQGDKLSSADAQRLYESARDYLMHGQPDQAAPLYAEVSARFPFSEYAPQSELEIITAHYRAHDYDQAVDAADRFIKQHPRNTHVDYAYYMRGLSNYAHNNPGFFGSNPDQRNVDYLKQAFNDFSQLVRNFPDSNYAKDAQLHMINIRNRLATHELHIAEYYYKRRAYIAASHRADDIIKHYQGSDSVPRAMEIMEESYAKLKLPDLADDTRSILQVSYPNYLLHRNEFYRQKAGNKAAYDLPDMGGPAESGKSADKDSSSDTQDSND